MLEASTVWRFGSTVQRFVRTLVGERTFFIPAYCQMLTSDISWIRHVLQMLRSETDAGRLHARQLSSLIKTVLYGRAC